MRKPNIAILGATGVVGREITKIVDELKIPFNEIKFLSSAKSAGTQIEFQGRKYTVEEAKPESFDGVNIVLASAGGSTSQKFAPEIVKRGAVLVDNSSAFRMEKDVPLVIAYVNDEDLRTHKGIIANPNCSTSQLMLVLKPLHEKAKIKRLIVSTYQAVSGAGLAAINELTADTKANLAGENFENKCFKKPISFNVIPQIDVFCEAVDIEFEEKISPEEVREILKNSFGVKVLDNPENFEYPTTRDASGVDPVFVGRIRKNLAFDNGISLWCVADNLRIGAALNTVRICQKLIEMDLF